MKHPIPNEALDDRLGFIGTSGSGKTYNAGGAVERLLHRKARVVIVDPLGVWWGLRLLADGRTQSPFDVAIFGGPHGDLPLTEHAGALIGETAATMAESCIIDLSVLGTKSSERRYMTAFLESLYRKASGEPFHLIVDEADLFAPQKPPKGDETLLHLMEQIVRRGRVKGFIPWLISQRPAVLNKNVLSQVDGLVAFKLTASQDRDALEAWIEGQADRKQGEEILGSLPAMQRGQGVVWVPGRGVLTTATFPPKVTFDSSATPKRGETKRSATLKPLNVEALKGRLATVAQEAEANDPKKLKAEIARLKADAAKTARVSEVEVIDPNKIIEAENCGYARGRAEARHDVGQLAKASATHLESASDNLRVIERIADAAPPRPAPAPARPAHRPPMRAAPAQPRRVNGSDTVRGGEQKILVACVQHEGCTPEQLTVLTGYKRSSRNTYVQRLRAAGLVEARGEKLVATPAGMQALPPDFEALPFGNDLLQYWIGRLPEGEGKILALLTDGGRSEWIDRDELDAPTGYKRSSRNTYLQRLGARQLIESQGSQVRASEALFG